ncbi:MAG: UDP-N-acetylmuramoylalanine--D-glutamate ligase [Patescibacteria group bacterium]|nr:UDP-N-acetylmuramoylalanine--D-glutamate ligase [Patescibacteria group bacterium]
MKKSPSILFYGKARVGEAVVALAKTLGIRIEQKDDSDSEFDASEYDAVIPTPGVPPTNRAHSGDNVLSELDFAYRYLPKGFKIVSVTGTDGKSTTAWILFELFRREYGDEKAFLSGNFEIPFSETVRRIREKGLKRGVIVVECSSFMLHDVGSARSLAALEKLPE